ncbi:hypothetical protein [Pelagicoccus sp. SDUM812003]|uniref:DUF6891 domain-containing protein n=1 Tax=Pelagicoccus sp. SDUM812003 TaxID=3041267 RepID=UPI00280C8F3C|nr:hypothetical protein [Pelagicoccus sp. SDUM812003]MDQ8205780.1 hypothetical protein [Pelagicoccus sp. SDUM812003]
MKKLLTAILSLLSIGTAKSTPSDTETADPMLEDIRHYARQEVAAGFSTEEEIVQNTIDILSDDYDEKKLREAVSKEVKQAISDHKAEQANWPKVTDTDRLDLAFQQLEELGIVCRQNFSCCGTCGSGEIWDEIEAQEKKKKVRGYIFYHMQDTESAVEGGGLYLNYGSTEEGEEPALSVARTVVETIEKNGLKTNWDGTWGMRIGVTLDWKKRR